MPRLLTALLLAVAFVAVVLYHHGTGCPPGAAFYFQRHDLLKDGRAIRMYPIYACRPVPADR